MSERVLVLSARSLSASYCRAKYRRFAEHTYRPYTTSPKSCRLLIIRLDISYAVCFERDFGFAIQAQTLTIQQLSNG